MNGATDESVAIIVAMTERATTDFPVRLARFSEEAGPNGEVFVIDSSGALSAEWVASKFPNVRVLYRPVGQLTPQLWRDGLVKTEATYVAFSTAQMLICQGWRVALIERLLEKDAVCVGGPIVPSRWLSGVDSAVALLRYSRYFPPLPSKKELEPPGDNSLYRRDRLKEVERLWIDGFWEVEVNKALRKRGGMLVMTAKGIATFVGGSRLATITGQRLRHARRYGAFRSKSSNAFQQVFRVLTSPLVPPLLCFRVFGRLVSRRMSVFRWIPAVPSLIVMACAWAAGEAIGTCADQNAIPDDPGPVRKNKTG
jgi:hypothetical protein